jgi:hypothetical protein
MNISIQRKNNMKKIVIVALMVLAISGCKKRDDIDHPVQSGVPGDESIVWKITTFNGIIFNGHKVKEDGTKLKFISETGMVVITTHPYIMEAQGK